MTTNEENSSASVEEDAYRWLRSHLAGFIRFDGERCALKVAPLPDGALVAPVMVAMLMAGDTVLELPDDGDDDLHLMVSLDKFDERSDEGGWADRWRTYHGSPPDVNWARITVDASKFRGYYIDGEVYVRKNPLAASEGALCRALNTHHRDDVKRAIRAQLAADAISPTVVGVDPWGLDVRREHDVIRLHAPAECEISCEASARQCVGLLTRA